MKVALLTHRFPPVYNGPGRAAEALANGLVHLGHSATVLTFRLPSQPSCRVVNQVSIVGFNLPFHTPDAHMSITFFVSLWFDLRSALWVLFNRKRVDVIQYALMPARSFFILKFIAGLLGIPVFARVTMLGGDDLKTIACSRNGKIRLRWCEELAGIITMTPELADTAGSAAKVVLLPKYIDTNIFRPPHDSSEKQLARQKLGLSSADFILLFVGAVEHRKGADLIIESFPAVLQQIPNVKLVFVGPLSQAPQNGIPFGEVLKSRAAEIKITAQVLFAGLQQEVHPWMRAADLFVFPSRNEGMPGALLEAMSTGLPTIIAQQSWVGPEFGQDKRFGRVISPNPEALAEAVVWSFKNPQPTAEMGIRGREFIQQNHGINTTVEKLVVLYKSALEATR